MGKDNDVKKEHKKYGKAMVLSMVMEAYVDSEFEKIDSRKKNQKQELNFYKKVKVLEKKKILTSEERKRLLVWRKTRNDLNHDWDEIPKELQKNKNFKTFLQEAETFCKKHEIDVPEYSNEKYKEIGWVVYISADMEKFIEEKCGKKNVSYQTKKKKDLPRKIVLQKLSEASKKEENKKRYDELAILWGKRNDVLHKKDECDKYSVEELDKLYWDIQKQIKKK